MYTVNANLSEFYNQYTLNIFSDASIINSGDNTTGCYGVACVVGDTMIDSCYHITSHTTNNNSEIKGIRTALSFANKWKTSFKYINIFSDSKISIDGLREYIFKWRYNPEDNLLYSSLGKPVANQSIFIECFQIMVILASYPDCIVRFYHQNGHVKNSYNELKKAAATFSKSNNIYGVIDINLIRYLATYNNLVDITSRSILRREGIQTEYIDPITFKAQGKISKKNIL